jgi:hypothetical protein
MNPGVRGTLVTLVKSRTSRTLAMSRANISSPSLNVRYWVVSILSAVLMAFSCESVVRKGAPPLFILSPLRERVG